MTTPEPQTSASPRLDLSEEDKTFLVRHIQRLVEIFDTCTNDPANASQERREEGPDPRFYQTRSGLYLEFYYGVPGAVWTPWGHWRFGAAPSVPTDVDGFMARLTVRMHKEAVRARLGTNGPIYAILAIDGEELPEPVLTIDRQHYLDYDTAKAEWRRFFTAD